MAFPHGAAFGTQLAAIGVVAFTAYQVIDAKGEETMRRIDEKIAEISATLENMSNAEGKLVQRIEQLIETVDRLEHTVQNGNGSYP